MDINLEQHCKEVQVSERSKNVDVDVQYDSSWTLKKKKIKTITEKN